MTPLTSDIADQGLIAYIDQWASLLEQEAYDEALAWTDHAPHQAWTAGRLRSAIKNYATDHSINASRSTGTCHHTLHLPEHHRDPFDRLLIAQALTENVAVVTGDPHFAAYHPTIIW